MTASTTTGLVAWLREQIAEDERVAQAAETRLNAWAPDLPPWESARYLGKFGSSFDDFVARHDPRAVLAQCEAHTAILDDCSDVMSGSGDGPDLADRTLRRLALAYQHRSGYQQEWRPQP